MALSDYSITVKLSQKKLQNMTINLSSYIFRAHTLITLTFFSFILLNFSHLYGRVSILSMVHFLKTDTREQQKYEKRMQTSLDNTLNDLRHEIKFENCVKHKNNFLVGQKHFSSFFKQKYFLILRKVPLQL